MSEDISSSFQDLTAEQSLSLADSLAIDEQLEEAVDAYAAAISLLSESSKAAHHELHIRALSHRSSAFIQLGRYQEALEDAQRALSLFATARPTGLRAGEGELCHKRAGLAAFELGDFTGTKNAMEQAFQLASLNKRPTDIYNKWIQKCAEKLAAPKVAFEHSLSEDPETPMVEEISPNAKKLTPASDAASKPAPTPAQLSTTASKTPARPQMPKYQYYQSDTVMTISVLEANVKEEDLNVRFEQKRLTVRLRKGGVDFTVIAGNLYSEVIVERCKVVYKDEKVLIKLRKKDSFEWQELFGKASMDEEKPKKKETGIPSANSKMPETVPTVKESTKVRPYASHRDWDAIERDVLEDEKKEKPEGDEAMNKLFQQIYSNADEDTRRAMIKSYQTSGGTVLSTNWNEVSKKDYEKERTAPDGIEWKNWEGGKLPMKKE